MRKLLLFAVAASLLLAAPVSMKAQMTDDAVVSYVQRQLEAGKNEKEIGKELLAKGVTQAQILRIKSKYEKAQSGASDDNAADGVVVRRKSVSIEEDGVLEGIIADKMASEQEKNREDSVKVYGMDVFHSRNLSFEPNENAATPEDYKLGPGDEIVIDIWGANEAHIRNTISPEGRISISQVGPIYLSGLTVKDAETKIRRQLAQKYAGVEGDNPTSDISVSLGQIRTIQVNVMGEVSTPGTYRLSSFSTVFTALYRAGGVSPIGSLRDIRVLRYGKEVGSVDVYDYLFNGSLSTDLKLQEGDVIIVPPYIDRINVNGEVKRPMVYELKDGQTLSDLIALSGGFSSEAFTSSVRVVRKNSLEREIFTVTSDNYSSFALENGDEVSVDKNLSRFSNKVEVNGSVFRPGIFELGGDIATVRQLVNAAGGLCEDAFLARALLLREKDDLSLQMESIDIGAIMSGKADDVLLRKNDILTVSGIHELKDMGSFTISGYVLNPSEYPYAENTTIEDLIIQAGGLLDGASTAKVDVFRRSFDPAQTEAPNHIGEVFTFSIKDGFAVDGADSFILKPYDVVAVRLSPGYKPQQFVSVLGEVAFEGEYAILNSNDRISDLVKRAGGVTSNAYVRGATLLRTISVDEKRRVVLSEKTLESGAVSDTLSQDSQLRDASYTVALELDKALASPGSEYDVILTEGDKLIVPKRVSTVRILGNVMSPNAVTYHSSKSVADYIRAAGGYGYRARRGKVYVMYMNGIVKKGASAKVEPGCVIFVPSKGEKNKTSLAEVLSLSSTAASLGTMVATLVNVIK